ncbi:MAG: hypothetical protein IID53_11695 [Proteobacteria bacterium]|nr:hypothetical protein [Pseudomonadota bacterium]
MLSRMVLCVLLISVGAGQSSANEMPAESEKIPVIIFERDPAAPSKIYPSLAPGEAPIPPAPGSMITPGAPPYVMYGYPLVAGPPGYSYKAMAASTGRRYQMDPAELAKNFQRFLQKLLPVFSGAPENIGPYVIDEIELHLTMNAQGGFALIGKAEFGVTGGVKIKLKRRTGTPP